MERPKTSMDGGTPGRRPVTPLGGARPSGSAPRPGEASTALCHSPFMARPTSFGRDPGLQTRIAGTLFLLGLVYVVLIGAIFFATGSAVFVVAIAGGLGSLSGRAFRIGHLGDSNPAMLLGANAGVEAALVPHGIPVGASGTRRPVLSLPAA